MQLEMDSNRLEVFTENRTRRIYVGVLSYEPDRELYKFEYDQKYALSKNAIPVGPDLDLFKKVHWSKGKKLFASLSDRIPSRANPAFEEYCRSVGISLNEKNPIVLLTTIGRKGPSTFVFEPVPLERFDSSQLIRIKKELGLSRYELARAFGLSVITVNRVEQNKSIDSAPARLIQIFLRFPDVALWQLDHAGRTINQDALARLRQYFQKRTMTE
ncbi:helix-turn-helix transcriptional regulator [Bdellovibrionota bacterium FG-1]